MSSRWLRELAFTATDSDLSFFVKAYALFVRYVLNYTFQYEAASGGASFVSTEKNGTGGSFSGTDYVFTISSGSFASTDLGKWLVVVDNSNPVNAGLYKIIGYTDTNNITIDFRAGYAEYPTASTGITWRVCGSTYQVPVGADDYVRLQSPHASGWAVELRVSGGTTAGSLRLRAATYGNWTYKTLGNMTGYDGNIYGFGLRKPWGSLNFTFYAEGDYDGNWLHLWSQTKDDISDDQYSGPIRMVSIETVDPIEAGVPAEELILLRGTRVDIPFSYDGGGRWYDGEYGRGQSWVNNVNDEVKGYLFDYSSSTYDSSFYRWSGREVNWRRDGKLEARYGSPYVIDENNARGGYRLLGYVQGHWSVPLMSAAYNQNIDNGTTYRKIHRMVAMNMSGTRDKLLLHDGIVVPWCGLMVKGL